MPHRSDREACDERGMDRARRQVVLLSLACGINFALLGAETHLPYLDIGLIFAIAAVTHELARVDAHRTIHVALAAMALRWFASVMALIVQPPTPSAVIKIVIGCQVVGIVVETI